LNHERNREIVGQEHHAALARHSTACPVFLPTAHNKEQTPFPPHQGTEPRVFHGGTFRCFGHTSHEALCGFEISDWKFEMEWKNGRSCGGNVRRVTCRQVTGCWYRSKSHSGDRSRPVASCRWRRGLRFALYIVVIRLCLPFLTLFWF